MPDNMMQSMIMPSYAAQQAQLMRNQALANALRQQAMASSDQQGTQVINGWAVPQNPLQSLSGALGKVLNAYTAKNLDTQNDAKLNDLNQQYAQSVAAMLRGGQSAPPSAAAGVNDSMAFPQSLTNSAISSGGQDMNTPGTMPVPQPTPQQPMQQGGGFGPQGMPANLRQLAFALDPSAYVSSTMKNYEATPEMKNAQWMGEDAGTLGKLDMAAKRKAAMMELQPGTTNVDLATGQRFFQPKLGEGMNYDPNTGVSSAVPGYAQGNAQIQGAQAGAVAGAQANFKPNTVTLPNGQTILASDAQLLGAARNGGLQLQNPAQAEVVKATGAAAANAQKVAAAAGPLLATIQEAKGLVNAVPSGPYGIAEGRADLANLPVVGNDKTAAAAARWQQLMGQLTMNGIASSGLGRMDIPIVNAIKESSNVPMGLSPEAKMAKLNQLEKAIRDHVASVQNEVSGLNQPGITATTGQLPMSPSAGAAAPAMPFSQDAVAAELKRRGL